VLVAGPNGAAELLSISGNQLFIDHGWNPEYVSSLPATPGTRNHIALTYDGSNTIQFYVNGVAANRITGNLYNYGVGTLEIGGTKMGPSFNG